MMDDKQFRRAQMIFGIVLGALAVLFLMVPLPFGEESATGIGNLWNLVIAMVLVMVVPRTVERKLGGQRILVTQKWMLIVFVAGMLISLGVNLIQGTPVLQQSAASPTPTIAPEVTPTAGSSRLFVCAGEIVTNVGNMLRNFEYTPTMRAISSFPAGRTCIMVT